MIKTEHFFKQVQTVLSNIVLILVINEALQRTLFKIGDHIIETGLNRYIVFVQIFIDLLFSEKLCNLNKLILIVFPNE